MKFFFHLTKNGYSSYRLYSIIYHHLIRKFTLFFLANPVLLPLAQEGAAFTTVMATITASAGTVMLAGGLEGWFAVREHWIERILFIAAALLLLYPGAVTDIAGLCASAILIAEQVIRGRKPQP